MIEWTSTTGASMVVSSPPPSWVMGVTPPPSWGLPVGNNAPSASSLTPQTCLPSLLVSEQSGTISDGPLDYLPYTMCRWQFTAAIPMTLTFTDLDLVTECLDRSTHCIATLQQPRSLS